MKKTIDLGGIRLTLEVEDVMPQNVNPSRFGMPTVCGCPTGEPDGIDAHIDRPRREYYGGCSWMADEAFERDLAKYRKAERAIKDCDWPTREPMGNVGCWPTPKRNCATTQPRDEWGRFTSKKTRCEPNVRWRDGIVPLGAKVVGHTCFGEPIFSK